MFVERACWGDQRPMKEQMHKDVGRVEFSKLYQGHKMIIILL